MHDFQTFAVSFCGVCVATGGIYMLVPESKMTKTVRYIIVLTLLTAFIGLFSVNFNIKLRASPAVEESSDTASSERLLTAVFEKALENSGIEFKKILIFTDKSKEGSITITKIQVYSPESPERILSAIGNSQAYDVEVID